MKFRFPYNGVLKHRKILEDIAQREFQEALAKLHDLEDALAKLIEEKQKARLESYRLQSSSSNEVNTLIQANEFIRGQDIRIELQKKAIQESEATVEKFRETLRQKAIDYKIIDNLKARRHKEFVQKEAKREQKMSDEMSTMRFKKTGVKE